ncbi:MAG TPA: hypothetical protein VMM37_05320 [Bacteroidota bacterium]|nr:hypothetical protein [Bacteroidota bacterium]
MSKPSDPNASTVLSACPHCGEKLSPWQQVLLGVDRALMCKNCWYRIVLDVIEEQKQEPEKPEEGHSPMPPKG